jgi:hypothetical protein
MSINEHERRQRQRAASHRQNEDHRQQKPRKQKRYLRKVQVALRYGWQTTMSVDRGWKVYRTIPPPSIYHGRIPLWDEEALDEYDAAHAFEASA